MNNLLLTSAISYLFATRPPPQNPACHHPTVVPKIINMSQIYNEPSNCKLNKSIFLFL
jgi:hypothetical protein